MSADLTRLLDILIAINRALEFVEGQDALAFESDTEVRWAVYSQAIIIGEASRRISREFQLEHPQIPWKDIIGMRHRLVHDYDDIAWELVWVTVTRDMPALKAIIEPLIPRESA